MAASFYFPSASSSSSSRPLSAFSRLFSSSLSPTSRFRPLILALSSSSPAVGPSIRCYAVSPNSAATGSSVASLSVTRESLSLGDATRPDFPILHQVVNGSNLVYFNNAATSQKPSAVVKAVNEYYELHNSNVHRGVHYLSAKASNLSTRSLQDLATAGRHHAVLSLFQLLCLSEPLLSIASILPSTLLSAAALSLPSAVSQLHSLSLKSGLLPIDPYVFTALLTAYSRLCLLPLARRLLDEVPFANAPTSAFNALITGYALASFPSLDSLALFRHMRHNSIPFDDVTFLALLPASPPVTIPPLHGIAFIFSLISIPSVSNCLLSCYSRVGAVDLARKLFNEMPDNRKDLVSWNAMISCYAQNGLAYQVLELYDTMEHSPSVEPDAVTFIGVLSSCAYLGAHSIGRKIEDYINQKSSFVSNVYLMNALMNLHAKCGDLAKARKIFDQIPQRTIVSWTAMIAGYGMHGQGEEALQLFDKMIEDGIKPDGIVMVSVLSACSHVGMANIGRRYFSSMKTVYGIVPSREHYACMVDLLGRIGQLKEARDLILSMPMKPDAPIWGALLGACKIHKNVEFAELAFNHVNELDPTNVGYYVLLSNIYSEAGRLDDVARIRAIIRQKGLKKDPGCSYVDYKGKVHLFMADDHSHPQANMIYGMVVRLEALVKNKGKITGNKGTKNVPLTGFHSEKLAISFGLLNTEAGVEIVVIKNLRVCEDCHQFMKMVSLAVNRKFVVRDASRFHHFEGGICSCKDYW